MFLILVHEASPLSDIQLKLHRAVIRTENFGADRSFPDGAGQPVGNQKIVNTPSGVFLPGAEAVGPPAVCTGHVGIQQTEAIGKAGLQQGGKSVPFLIGKARVSPIGTRIF